MRLRDAVRTGFQDGDNRCVSDAAVLAVDTDAQPVAWGGA
jgi:hypothetical protein